MIGKPLKDGDTILTVPSDYHGLVRFGFIESAFLKFCANHPKPFGFRWRFDCKECPKCGDQFVEDRERSFVMITHGYTVTEIFRYGIEVYSRRMMDEWPEFIEP